MDYDYDVYDFQNVSPSEGTFWAPSTQVTDLPSVNYDTYDFQGTSAQPAISEIPRSTSSFDFSGVLKPITATANAFMDVWKGVTNISTSAATMKAQNEIQRAQLDLAKTGTLGSIEVAKLRAGTEAKIAQIQAANQVEKESQILRATQGGMYGVAQQAGPSVLVLAGLGLSLWLAFRGKK